MKEIEKSLFEYAVKCAFESELESFVQTEESNMPEIPKTLERRINSELRVQRRQKIINVLKKYSYAAACFVLITVMCFAMIISNSIAASDSVYSMLSEQDNGTLYIWFIPKDEDEHTKFTPMSAANVLEYQIESKFTVNCAYVEQYYSGVRFEQYALWSDGRIAVPIQHCSIKNIVIGGYPAFLVSSAESSLVIWRNDDSAFCLSGLGSADTAMSIARSIN